MTMIAGKYFVGDLSYALGPDWDQVLGLIFKGEGKDITQVEGEFNLSDGRRFAIFSTKVGDGVFEDQEGRAYGVDSGNLGVVALEDARFGSGFEVVGAEVYSRPHNVLCGHSVNFAKAFKCVSTHLGVRFGHIEIETMDEEDVRLYAEAA
jgi:hypothetical protein